MDDLRAYVWTLFNFGNGCYFVFFSLCQSHEKDFQGEKRRSKEQPEYKKKEERKCLLTKGPFDLSRIYE